MAKRSIEWHEKRCRWARVSLEERHQCLESARLQYEEGLLQYRKDYDEWEHYEKEIQTAKAFGVKEFNRGEFLSKKKGDTENGKFD